MYIIVNRDPTGADPPEMVEVEQVGHEVTYQTLGEAVRDLRPLVRAWAAHQVERAREALAGIGDEVGHHCACEACVCPKCGERRRAGRTHVCGGGR